MGGKNRPGKLNSVVAVEFKERRNGNNGNESITEIFSV